MSAALGHDFSQVRVHTDAEAAESATAVGALAYTFGNEVVFAPGQYRPHSQEGRTLLAHELTHTLQQLHATPHVARQCDPAWQGLDWETRVNNARVMANGAAKHQCMADMIDEALYPNVVVHEATNTEGSVNAAVAANRYTEWGSIAEMHVNFDRNLNAKTGNANQFGETTFRVPPGGNDIDIYIVLGNRSLNPIGPEYTRMALDHESSHAWDFVKQFSLIGAGPPHAAKPGEELAIYTEGFSLYFLELWEIDNAARTFQVAETFPQLFSNYASATQTEKDSAFYSIETFYSVRIKGHDCNMMKFKIWLQMMQNTRGAADPLIARINSLPDLGLTRGTAPSIHFDPALGCG